VQRCAIYVYACGWCCVRLWVKFQSHFGGGPGPLVPLLAAPLQMEWVYEKSERTHKVKICRSPGFHSPQTQECHSWLRAVLYAWHDLKSFLFTLVTLHYLFCPVYNHVSFCSLPLQSVCSKNCSWTISKPNFLCRGCLLPPNSKIFVLHSFQTPGLYAYDIDPSAAAAPNFSGTAAKFFTAQPNPSWICQMFPPAEYFSAQIWREHKWSRLHCYLAEMYLAMPPASVTLECLFSSTALIANGKHSSLKPYKLGVNTICSW